jgi:response regulator RpfG family c-di-GMP phosphodiesterase
VQPQTQPRILCVDDEPSVLQGFGLTLRRHFRLTTATSGNEALAKLSQEEPFAVVMSDMRMPGMSGATLLARVREVAPSSVRILLTGHSDFNSAVEAVNEGQIFRFLSKPCPPDTLIKTLWAGVDQHRLLTLEKDLLEKTLRGAIQALSAILDLAQPRTFGRALRVQRMARKAMETIEIGELWPIEVAAAVSQLGCITVPSDIADRALSGKPLSATERAMIDRVPAMTLQILGNLPRLEKVTEILENLDARYDAQGRPPSAPRGTFLPIGARLLHVLFDYDQLDAAEHHRAEIFKILRGRPGVYDPAIVDAWETTLNRQAEVAGVQTLRLADLRPGMVLATDLKTAGGTLLMARGHELTAGSLERLRNFSTSVGLSEPIYVTGRPEA